MSIKNPVKTSNLTDFGEIASKATTSGSIAETEQSRSKKASPAQAPFEQQLEDEINKRAKKEGLL